MFSKIFTSLFSRKRKSESEEMNFDSYFETLASRNYYKRRFQFQNDSKDLLRRQLNKRKAWIRQLLRTFETIKQDIPVVEEQHIFMVGKSQREKIDEKIKQRVQMIKEQENILRKWLLKVLQVQNDLAFTDLDMLDSVDLDMLDGILMKIEEIAKKNLDENIKAYKLKKCLENSFMKGNDLRAILIDIIKENSILNDDYHLRNHSEELENFLNFQINVQKNLIDIESCSKMSNKIDISLKKYRNELFLLYQTKINKVVQMLTDIRKIIPLIHENINRDKMEQYLEVLNACEENESDNELENFSKLETKAIKNYERLKKVHNELKLTLEIKQMEAVELFNKRKTEVLQIKGTKIDEKISKLASFCDKKKEEISNEFKQQPISEKPFELTQKELDNLKIKQTQLEHADEKVLEQVASQIVSGYFDKKIDITAGFRNFQRLNFVLSEIEFQIRKFLLPYLTLALKEKWSDKVNLKKNEYISKSQYDKHCQKISNIDGKSDDYYVKMLLSLLKNTYVEEVSNLNHLDVNTELEIQNIWTMFRYLKRELSDELDNTELFTSLFNLLKQSASIRNNLSHLVLIQNNVFQQLRNDIIASIKTFTEAANASKKLLPLAEKIHPKTLDEMMVNKFPEREVQRLSGIQFKLPIENRKRRKLTANNSDSNSALTIRDWCEKLLDLNKNKRTDKEKLSTVMEFFENFPNLKKVYYDAYNQQQQQ